MILRKISSGKEVARRKQVGCSHSLQPTDRRGHWFCDGCRKDSKRNASIKQCRYRCVAGCNFDLCEDCFNVKQAAVEAEERKAAVEAELAKVCDPPANVEDSWHVPEEGAEIVLPRSSTLERRIAAWGDALGAEGNELGSDTQALNDPAAWTVPEDQALNDPAAWSAPGDQAQISMPRHVKTYRRDAGDGDASQDEGCRCLPKAAWEPDATNVLHEGCSVVLRGLSGDAARHNGELCVLSKCGRVPAEYEATLQDGQRIRLPGTEHLVVVDPKGEPSAVGIAVVLRGLGSHKELNGGLARRVRVREDDQLIEVRSTEGGQLYRLKLENALPASGPVPAAAPQGGRRQADATASTGGSVLRSDSGEFCEPGSLVEIRGLKTAQEFNGQQAKVVSVDRSSNRYVLRLSNGDSKTIRCENVCLISQPEFCEPGSLVEMHSLKAAPEFNGQQAEVVSVDHASDRYVLRLSDGDSKTIRFENVRLISQPSKASI